MADCRRRGGALRDDAAAIVAAYKGGGSSVNAAGSKRRGASSRSTWVDAMIVNSEGETPCFMQLHAASKRPGARPRRRTLLLDFLNIASRVLELESTGMWVIKILLGLVGAASAFDTLLALRWYWKAWSASYISNHPRTKALEKKAEKKAAKEAARLKRAD